MGEKRPPNTACAVGIKVLGAITSEVYTRISLKSYIDLRYYT